MNNWLGLLICFAYIFGMIGLAEGLRRWRGYSSSFTRKVIHIGVGMLSWLLPFVFDTPWFFVGAAGAFAFINLLDWHYGFFAAMASSDETNLGTVYFPLVAAVVVILFWEQPPLMVAAIMPLTWGDGLASVFGQAYGRHPYTIFGHQRSLEGSLTFFLAGGLFTWLALWLLPGAPELTPLGALAPTAVTMVLATAVEAISVFGLDNVTVTAAAIGVFWFWPF